MSTSFAAGFNPAHPLLVAVSVLEADVAALGGLDCVMRTISDELETLFIQKQLLPRSPVALEGGYVFNLRFPLIGAKHANPSISAILLCAPRNEGRPQWLVHLVSNPAFYFLSLEDRITLQTLQTDIADKLTDHPSIEDVDLIDGSS